MKMRLLAAGIMAVVLGLATVAFVAAQGTTPDENGPHGTGEGYPPVVAFLQAVPPAQRFDHLRTATVNVVDQNGAPVAINYIPGTVSSVSGTSLVVTPNGETTTRTFGITSKTLFRGTPAPGSNALVTTGDRVVVMATGSSSDAVIVTKYFTPPSGTPSPSGGATPTQAPRP